VTPLDIDALEKLAHRAKDFQPWEIGDFAMMRNALPQLLAIVRAADALREEIKQSMGNCCDCGGGIGEWDEATAAFDAVRHGAAKP
jgi:hypothetical protein